MRALVLIIVAACGAIAASASVAAPHAESRIPAIMAADIGATSGSPELMYIERNFTAERVLPVPTCVKVSVGSLAVAGKAQPMRVVLAYSGIGAVAAALCVQALVTELNLEYILWPGTAGASAVIGGPFAKPMTRGACTLNDDATMLSLGSTCVTSKTANIMCGMCQGEQTSSFPVADECAVRRCSGQNNTMGQCLFALNTSLADKVSAATATYVAPPMPAAMMEHAEAWWTATLGKPTTVNNWTTPTRPTFFAQCATTTTANLIDPSLPMDAWCRDAVGTLVGKHPDEVPCVSDMEDTGVAQALAEMAPEVPIAFIRGMSNYGNSPLYRGELAGYGTYWGQNFTWAPAATLEAFNKEGYNFAVRITNEIVLHFLASL